MLSNRKVNERTPLLAQPVTHSVDADYFFTELPYDVPIKTITNMPLELQMAIVAHLDLATRQRMAPVSTQMYVAVENTPTGYKLNASDEEPGTYKQLGDIFKKRNTLTTAIDATEPNCIARGSRKIINGVRLMCTAQICTAFPFFPQKHSPVLQQQSAAANNLSGCIGLTTGELGCIIYVGTKCTAAPTCWVPLCTGVGIGAGVGVGVAGAMGATCWAMRLFDNKYTTKKLAAVDGLKQELATVPKPIKMTR